MNGMVLAAAPSGGSAFELQSLYDVIIAGGPLMWPIGLCSVIALAYIVERSIRLRQNRLGGTRFARELEAAVRDGGPRKGLELCEARAVAMARVIGAGLKRFGQPALEVEKAVEDAGAREVKQLASNLKPLVVVTAIAPLLGLLGTVYGMIQAFSQLALKDQLGKPELLASGIAQALITTAAGLTVAIPSQAAYYWLKGRIDRFVRATEQTYEGVADALRGAAGAVHANP